MMIEKHDDIIFTAGWHMLMLDKLEQILIDVALNYDTITYLKLAQRLGLQPPHIIHQAAELVETLMRLHAKTGVPQLASVVISRARGGLPAPGYFILLSELGLYSGSVDGADAREFHAQEKQRLQSELRRDARSGSAIAKSIRMLRYSV